MRTSFLILSVFFFSISGFAQRGWQPIEKKEIKDVNERLSIMRGLEQIFPKEKFTYSVDLTAHEIAHYLFPIREHPETKKRETLVTRKRVEIQYKDLECTLIAYRRVFGHFRTDGFGSLHWYPDRWRYEVVSASLAMDPKAKRIQLKDIPKPVRTKILDFDLAFELGDGEWDYHEDDRREFYKVLDSDGKTETYIYVDYARHIDKDEFEKFLVRFDSAGKYIGPIARLKR